MVKVATQTPIISLFLLILSLETSFIPSIALNLSVVAFCILFMLYYRRFKMLAWMIILAILPSYHLLPTTGQFSYTEMLHRQLCLERGPL
ncbi:cobalt ABC transporter domain-containing protein [Streptococcus pneumoniae]|nr:cobalt ABC transporter domain-containing protein [Streptococcus pneumoniae]